jgi:hypothetical protein
MKGFSARAAHLCDVHQLPAMETLQRIGKDAISRFETGGGLK